MAEKIIVTGGAGFIGSELVRSLVSTGADVLNIDLLTYAGNLANLREVEGKSNYKFAQADICDRDAIQKLILEFQPNALIHLAAESHVDRSIDGPAAFIQTNLVGTFNLLECTRSYWSDLSAVDKEKFRFITVSTDEVYGSLGDEGKFLETTPYHPNSPYSASKAGADHLTRAWLETYGLPTIVTNCSNNYGQYQFPEKLIPLTIQKMLNEESIPIYGDGSNIRDWLFVADHVSGIRAALTKGKPGETYNIGGDSERSNLEVAETLCSVMDKMKPRSNGAKYRELVTFVTDRPGHDFRYAIDASKIKSELDWAPSVTFEQGMEMTLKWYLDHADWVAEVTRDQYEGERLGHKKG